LYDIIGDIHGYADELFQLLEQMGYERSGGLYTHRDRKAVFVGDFIDGGPQIAEVLRVVRPMIDNGHAEAVMGNHEFNAIAYHTPDPANPGKFLREHSDKNYDQHAETMRQLTVDEFREAVAWFRTLPMWLDLDGIRIVHACWDEGSMKVIDEAIRENGGVSTDFMQTAMQKSSPLFQAVEDVLKGKEVSLPDGVTFKDKKGHPRSEVRIRWFEHPAGKTFSRYALPARNDIPDKSVPNSVLERVTPYEHSEPPVFFGHYWLKSDRPARLAPNVACVDYSVAKHGSLCAYRWDGETELNDKKFVWVDARQ
jgi:hypothetical protein